MKFTLICFALIASSLARRQLAGFSPKAQDAIVKAHNDVRSAIAKGDYMVQNKSVGPASNMYKLFWDDQLASSAQEYANTCPSDQSFVPGLGENLYWSLSETPTEGEPLDHHGVEAAKRWEEEFESEGWKGHVFTEASDPIGHATQMAWCTTTAIGCGVKDCGFKKEFEMYTTVVVCLYQKQGNVVQKRIFQKGEPCTKCASGFECEEETGLCF